MPAYLKDIPLHGHVELGQVDPDVNDGRWELVRLGVGEGHLVSLLVFVPQINLKVDLKTKSLYEVWWMDSNKLFYINKSWDLKQQFMSN